MQTICVSHITYLAFGPKRGEVTGGWKKLHNKELHGLYCSPNIVRMIKSRRMRWACSADGRGVYRFRWGNPRKRDHWGDPGVGGMIILRRIFRKWDEGVWTGLGWLRIETGGEQL
jgi:hypothetical protein